MNSPLKRNTYSLEERWQAIANPTPTATEKAFADFDRHTHRRRPIANCCSREIRARQLVQFSLPPGWDLDKCIRHSLDLPRLSPGLEDSLYMPHICSDNLANGLKARRRGNLESDLPFDGVAFHQMQPLLRFDSHYFNRPRRPASFFPDIHPVILRFDQTYEPINFK